MEKFRRNVTNYKNNVKDGFKQFQLDLQRFPYDKYKSIWDRNWRWFIPEEKPQLSGFNFKTMKFITSFATRSKAYKDMLGFVKTALNELGDNCRSKNFEMYWSSSTNTSQGWGQKDCLVLSTRRNASVPNRYLKITTNTFDDWVVDYHN